MRTYFLFYVQKPNGNIRPQMVDCAMTTKEGLDDYLEPGDTIAEDLGTIKIKGYNEGMLGTSMVGD